MICIDEIALTVFLYRVTTIFNIKMKFFLKIMS